MIYDVSKENNTYSIGEALRQILPGDELHIESGTYYECLTFNIPNIRVVGENAEKTVITFDNNARMPMEDGTNRGTFRSYTSFVDTHDITFENITFENSSGDGRVVGQALAMYAEGHKIHFKNCRFLGYQDTLFTGPLPDEAVLAGGFTGPKEFSPRVNGLQWYENCYIEGDVDFIFGCATAVFTNCTICSLSRDMDPEGYITAPSTPKGQKYGYIFSKCSFIHKGCKDNSVYLSRPWREWAKAVFIECKMGNHIKPEGYHDWNKPASHDHSFYAEYPCDKSRVEWAKRIGISEKAEYDDVLKRIMAKWDTDSFTDII